MTTIVSTCILSNYIENKMEYSIDLHGLGLLIGKYHMYSKHNQDHGM